MDKISSHGHLDMHEGLMDIAHSDMFVDIGHSGMDTDPDILSCHTSQHGIALDGSLTNTVVSFGLIGLY